MTKTGSTSNLARFPWLFLVLTYGFSWLFWIPITLSGKKVALPLIAIGGFSPSFFGILMTYLATDKASRHDFWRRVISYRLISIRWSVVIILLFPLIMTMTFVLEILLGGTLPPLEGVRQTLTRPIPLLMFIIMMFIGGPLMEELGWRGFALDRLQDKWNALPQRTEIIRTAIYVVVAVVVVFVWGPKTMTMKRVPNAK